MMPFLVPLLLGTAAGGEEAKRNVWEEAQPDPIRSLDKELGESERAQAKVMVKRAVEITPWSPPLGPVGRGRANEARTHEEAYRGLAGRLLEEPEAPSTPPHPTPRKIALSGRRCRCR